MKNEDLILFAEQDVRVETCAVAPCVMLSGAVVLLNVVVVLLWSCRAANQGHNQPSAESAVRNIDTLQCPAATTAASPLQNGDPSGLQQILSRPVSQQSLHV